MKRMLPVLLVLLAVTSNAQAPQLVEDIVVGSSPSNPQRLTVFNDKLYFTASDATHGRELWEWHAMGTPAVRITDLYAGTLDGTGGASLADAMYVYKGKLYFNSRTSSTKTNLMAYDGVNPPGAVRTLTSSGGTVYGPAKMMQYSSKLYFVDDSAASYVGYLYSYNGSSAPVQVTHGFSSNNWQSGVMPYKGKLYGDCDDIIHGSELSVYDTATGQLSMVAELMPGKYGSGPGNFLVFGNKMYFTASDSAHGRELWSYDGTTLSRLTDVQPGTDDGATFNGGMTVFKGQIYFCGRSSVNHNALYRYDTVTKTVKMVYDAAPGLTSYSLVSSLFATSNNLYFYYNHPTTGELYAYNGTSGKLVADLDTGKANGAGFSNMVLYHNNVYFSGNNGTTNMELYRLFDGESAGIQSAAWSGEVLLYPNPASASATLSLTLQSTQSLRIVLTDICGKEVFSTGVQSFASGKNEVILPMQSLAAGQYFYRISGNDRAMLASGAVVKQ